MCQNFHLNEGERIDTIHVHYDEAGIQALDIRKSDGTNQEIGNLIEGYTTEIFVLTGQEILGVYAMLA